MEILGFFDEPYRIQVDPPRQRPAPSRPAGTGAPPPQPPQQGGRDAGSRIASLWESMDVGESLLDWKPTIISRRKLGGHTLSTGVVVGSLLLSALVSALLWFVLNRGPQLEAAADAALVESAAETSEAVSDLIVVAENVGTDEAPDLTEASATILTAESAARELFTRAGDLDAADPRRDETVDATSRVLDASGRTSRLLAYRLAAERILVPPSVPTDLQATELAAATEAVTAWRADVEAALEELPGDTLPAHRRQVAQWVDGLAEWQTRYLDGVREGDSVAVAAAVTDETASVRRLEEGLLARLGRAGGEVVDELSTVPETLGSLGG